MLECPSDVNSQTMTLYNESLSQPTFSISIFLWWFCFKVTYTIVICHNMCPYCAVITCVGLKYRRRKKLKNCEVNNPYCPYNSHCEAINSPCFSYCVQSFILTASLSVLKVIHRHCGFYIQCAVINPQFLSYSHCWVTHPHCNVDSHCAVIKPIILS